MFYSNKILYALLLSGAVLCGCSYNDDMVTDSPENGKVETANVVFRLQTNVPSATQTRTVEDSYEHIRGTADEYRVDYARVYLYDAPTKLFVKSVLLTNLKRTDNASIVEYETERVTVPEGTYDIFVVANSDKDLTQTKEEDFLARIDSTTYARGLITDISKGVVMSNRASDNVGQVIRNKSNSGKSDNVVSITLERVLARIDIARAYDSYSLTDDNNKQYATLTMDRHYIVNLPKYYYSFRHTAVLSSLEAPEWRLPQNFGDVSENNGYVIDPYFFNKTISAVNFTNQDNYYENYFSHFTWPYNGIQWTKFKQATEFNTAYCLENCMLQPAQKNGYSTGVIFDAKFEPYNNLYRLDSNGDFVLITDKSNYPEELFYYNYKFYNSAEALAKAVGVGSVSTDNTDIYQAKKFKKTDDGYHCYYYSWIRHLNNWDNTKMGVMEFAIVRNNLYKMIVASVSGLGDGEIPEVPDPDKPDEGETNLKVILNVKPWIVRENQIEL